MKISSAVFFVICTVLVPVPSSGSNITFNTVYDTTVTSNPNAAQIESAFAFAEQQFSKLFSDPITINLKVVFPDDNGLGSSLASFDSTSFAYSDVRNALIADAKSPDDATAIANNFPAADPTGGGRFDLTTANAKALGLLSGSDPALDGTVFFGAKTAFTFDPNNRTVAGEFDFIGTAEHEIAEVMGRNTSLDANPSGFQPFDLFRFTAPGVRNFNGAPTPGVYFSIDNGGTNLKGFNGASGGDLQDWDDTNPFDAFNAFGPDNQQSDITGVDQRVMDVIGYDPVASVPEPGYWVPLAAGLSFVIVRSRPRRSRH